jgi:type I restriction enzyme, R subunit
MPKLTSEATFEAVVEDTLLKQQGYLRAKPEDYDRDLCLYPTTVLRFIQVTQPAKWASYVRLLGSDAGPRLLRRLRDVVDRKGTLNALRRGVDESGHHFDLCYFQPTRALNPDLVRLFEANVFQVVRQLKYSKYNENSLDLAIFLNGLPIFTAELKNQVSGQTVEHAKKQYCENRDPKEPLLSFRRCLAHFAVDNQLVRFTTELAQKSTRFHPFDQGHDGGAGNPPSATGYATSYLWEHIWSRVSVLDLIQRFIRLIKVVDDKGRLTGKEALIFPRYHQLDTVRRCTAHAQANGTGQAYLNQHSAGSGKTIEIATLANSLSLLHGADNKPVFNTVIVISDRRVIDRQLQRTLTQFTDTPGVLENIDEGSRQLADALRDGKKIIVSTLQKFPFLLEKIVGLPAMRFAVIIDEAHSSQSGTAAMGLNKIVALGEVDADTDPEDDKETEDWEDRINDAMAALGRRPHVSYFAFTATPKEETLRLFGTAQRDGSYRPFTLYPMRQAIEEGFILDVLRNYTSYDQYFNLLRKAQDDPAVDKAKALRLLKQFVHDDRRPIRRKARIMVDHFRAHLESRIGGRAKAMIVTRNRLNAMRFAVEVRNYLAELGSPARCLVAFTGTVKDPDNGGEFTEAGMNGFPETQTATNTRPASTNPCFRPCMWTASCAASPSCRRSPASTAPRRGKTPPSSSISRTTRTTSAKPSSVSTTGWS